MVVKCLKIKGTKINYITSVEGRNYRNCAEIKAIMIFIDFIPLNLSCSHIFINVLKFSVKLHGRTVYNKQITSCIILQELVVHNL